MSATEIIALIISLLAGGVSLTSILTWHHNRTQRNRTEGAEQARTAASLDTIKLQNETLLAGNREICTKLDDQNTRLVKLEQTVENANLAAMPSQIAAINESVKSAHRRIDKLDKH